MAAGFKISVDLGNQKQDYTVANAAVPTAGLEILVDSTKFTEPGVLARTLRRVAEAILEGQINVNAYTLYPPA